MTTSLAQNHQTPVDATKTTAESLLNVRLGYWPSTFGDAEHIGCAQSFKGIVAKEGDAEYRIERWSVLAAQRAEYVVYPKDAADIATAVRVSLHDRPRSNRFTMLTLPAPSASFPERLVCHLQSQGADIMLSAPRPVREA